MEILAKKLMQIQMIFEKDIQEKLTSTKVILILFSFPHTSEVQKKLQWNEKGKDSMNFQINTL